MKKSFVILLLSISVASSAFGFQDYQIISVYNLLPAARKMAFPEITEDGVASYVPLMVDDIIHHAWMRNDMARRYCPYDYDSSCVCVETDIVFEDGSADIFNGYAYVDSAVICSGHPFRLRPDATPGASPYDGPDEMDQPGSVFDYPRPIHYPKYWAPRDASGGIMPLSRVCSGGRRATVRESYGPNTYHKSTLWSDGSYLEEDVHWYPYIYTFRSEYKWNKTGGSGYVNYGEGKAEEVVTDSTGTTTYKWIWTSIYDSLAGRWTHDWKCISDNCGDRYPPEGPGIYDWWTSNDLRWAFEEAELRNSEAYGVIVGDHRYEPAAGAISADVNDLNLFCFPNLSGNHSILNYQILHAAGSPFFRLRTGQEYVPAYPIPMGVWLPYPRTRAEMVKIEGPPLVAMAVVPFWDESIKWYSEGVGYARVGYAPAKALGRNIVYPPDAEVEESKWLNPNPLAVSTGRGVWPVQPFVCISRPSPKGGKYQTITLPGKIRMTIDHGAFQEISAFSFILPVDEQTTYVDSQTVEVATTTGDCQVPVIRGSLDDPSRLHAQINFAVGPPIVGGGYQGEATVTAEVIECEDAPEMVGMKSSFKVIMSDEYLQLSASPDSISSDGSEKSVITARLVNVKKRTPVAGKVVRFVADVGRLSQLSGITDSEGEVKVSFSLGPSSYEGQSVAHIVATSGYLRSSTNIDIKGKNLLKIVCSPDESLPPGSYFEIRPVVTDEDGNVRPGVSCSFKVSLEGPAHFSDGSKETTIPIGVDYTPAYVNEDARIGEKLVIRASTVPSSGCTDRQGNPLTAEKVMSVSNVSLVITSPVLSEGVATEDSNRVRIAGYVKVEGNPDPDYISKLKIDMEVIYTPPDYRCPFGNPQGISPEGETMNVPLSVDSLGALRMKEGNDIYLPLRDYTSLVTITVSDTSGYQLTFRTFEIKSPFYLEYAQCLCRLNKLSRAGVSVPEMYTTLRDYLKAFPDSTTSCSKAKRLREALERAKEALFLVNASNVLVQEDVLDYMSKSLADFITLNDLLSGLPDLNIADAIREKANVLTAFKNAKFNSVGLQKMQKVYRNTSRLLRKYEKRAKWVASGGRLELSSGGTTELVTADRERIRYLYKNSDNMVSSIQKGFEGKYIGEGTQMLTTRNRFDLSALDVKKHFMQYIKNRYKVLLDDQVHIINAELRWELSGVRTISGSPQDANSNLKAAYRALNDLSVVIHNLLRGGDFAANIFNGIGEAGGLTSFLSWTGIGAVASRYETYIGVLGRNATRRAQILASWCTLNRGMYLLSKGVRSILHSEKAFDRNDPTPSHTYAVLDKLEDLRAAVDQDRFADVVELMSRIEEEYLSAAGFEAGLSAKSRYIQMHPSVDSDYLLDLSSEYLQKYYLACLQRSNLLVQWVAYAGGKDQTEVRERFLRAIDMAEEGQRDLEEVTSEFVDQLGHARVGVLLAVTDIDGTELDSGESSEVTVTVENLGEEDSQEVAATLHILQPDGTWYTTKEDVGSIEAHGKREIAFPLRMDRIGKYRAFLDLTTSAGDSLTGYYGAESFDISVLGREVSRKAPETGTVISDEEGDIFLKIGSPVGECEVGLKPVSARSIGDPGGNYYSTGIFADICLDDASGTPLEEFPEGEYYLCFRYNPEDLGGVAPEDMTIAWLDLNSGKWVALNTECDPQGHMLTSRIEKSGIYGVLYTLQEIKYVEIKEEGTGFRIDWELSGLHDVSGVNIQMSEDQGATWKDVVSGVSDSTYLVSGLEPDGEYLFKLSLQFADGTCSKGVVYRALRSSWMRVDVVPKYAAGDSTPFVVHFELDGLNEGKVYEYSVRICRDSTYYGSFWDTRGDTTGWGTDYAFLCNGVSDFSKWAVVRAGEKAGKGRAELVISVRVRGESSPFILRKEGITLMDMSASGDGSWVHASADSSAEGNFILIFSDSTLVGSYVAEDNHISEGYDSTAAGYFRMAVPANIRISAIELRDADNFSHCTQNGDWHSGGPGSEMDLDEQVNVRVDVSEEVSPIPRTYKLFQSYPNPFNSRTVIRYQIPEASLVRIEIYNVIGQLVRRLVRRHEPAGFYSVVWDGRDCSGRSVASGVYFYRLVAGKYVDIKKMVLLK